MGGAKMYLSTGSGMKQISKGGTPWMKKSNQKKLKKAVAGKGGVPIVQAVKPKLVSKVPYTIYRNSDFVRMKFVDKTELNASVTTDQFGTQKVYYLNSIRQPRSTQTSGNTLPQGYDEADAGFINYKVYGAKVKITFAQASAGTTGVGALVVGSSDSTNIQSLTHMSLSTKKWSWYRDLPVTGDDKVVYNRYWDIGQIEGLSKQQFKNDINLYKGSFSSGPSAIPSLKIAMIDNEGTSAPKCEVTVEITYYVRLYNRQKLPVATTA